jgi:A/G-specific adenine glycosylase
MQKKKAISRFLNFIVVDTGKLTLLQKRTGKGIWQNLYEPPCIETKEIVSNSLAPESIELLDVFKNINNLSLKRTYECKHQLTHQNILAVFWVANCKTSDIKDNKHYVKSSWQNINQFAVHRLFDKFLKYYTLHHAP